MYEIVAKVYDTEVITTDCSINKITLGACSSKRCWWLYGATDEEIGPYFLGSLGFGQTNLSVPKQPTPAYVSSIFLFYKNSISHRVYWFTSIKSNLCGATLDAVEV